MLSLDVYADAQGAWLRVRNKHVSVTVHGVAGGLVELEFAAAEHGRDGDVHLGVRERHAQATTRALAETDHVARQELAVGRFGGVEPALRPKGEAVRENFFVVRDGEVGHGDDGSGREHVGFVRDGLCVGGAGSTLGSTVG